MVRFLIFLFAISLWPALAEARSLALIIGNDRYDNVPSLVKAGADAEGYAAFLSGRGVEVSFHKNLDARTTRRVFAEFLDQINPGDQVIFIYAGHGWSDGAQNYLAPTDIPGRGSPTLIKAESIPLENGANGVIDQIHMRGAGLTVAIIDACRDNPFVSTDTTRNMGLSRGLAPVQPPRGTFLAFSAGAGQTALDRLSDNDPARYSVFTRHFLLELAKPQDLQSAFKATQQAVFREARKLGHQQRPAYYDEVVGSACLAGNCVGSLVEPEKSDDTTNEADRFTAARLEWQDFKDSNSARALESFAARHTGTPYADLALDKADMLKERKASRPTEPVQPVRPHERPSWCPNAGTSTERAICADPELSELDIALGVLYRQALSRNDNAGLRARQRAWLDQRDLCGSRRSCLLNAYRDRVRKLGDGRG